MSNSYCPRCGGVVEGEDDPYGLRIRLLWVWRALTFWVQRKRRRERLEDEAFVRQFEPWVYREGDHHGD